jgi:hypothetical protein
MDPGVAGGTERNQAFDFMDSGTAMVDDDVPHRATAPAAMMISPHDALAIAGKANLRPDLLLIAGRA